MKRIWTTVFVFVPICVESGAHAWSVVGKREHAARSVRHVAGQPGRATTRVNGKDPKNALVAGGTAGNMPTTADRMTVLPNHLFWTWFIDNPRGSSTHNS
jgi:hypothetical protein